MKESFAGDDFDSKDGLRIDKYVCDSNRTDQNSTPESVEAKQKKLESLNAFDLEGAVSGQSLRDEMHELHKRDFQENTKNTFDALEPEQDLIEDILHFFIVIFAELIGIQALAKKFIGDQSKFGLLKAVSSYQTHIRYPKRLP